MAVRALALAALILATTGCQAAAPAREAAMPADSTARPTLGLMTTLPLLWGEAATVGDVLADRDDAGWVRGALEARYVLEPLDVLDAEHLRTLRSLVMAQPRVLSAPENVALDAWVRAGGRVLIFADPLLTAHSRFPIGDRRRPQDAVLLSPLLAHWGLTLTFDDDQPQGEHQIIVAGHSIPVDQAGALVVTTGSGCRLAGDGLFAQCRIGKGRATILADAAVLAEDEDIDPAARRQAVEALVRAAFD